MAEKTKKNEVDIDALLEQIERLNAENAKLELENGDLRAAMKHSDSIALDYERRLSVEHKKRMHERNESVKTIEDLTCDNECLRAQVDAVKELRALEQSNRHRSIPKFVLASLIAMGLIAVPYTLAMTGDIDLRLAFGIEAPLMMAISWCYALIWDRSRK